MSSKIVSTELDALKTRGSTVSESLATSGSLVARRLSKSTNWYFQYRINGKQRRYPFGEYSQQGDGAGNENETKYTLAGARRRANTLSAIHEQHGDVIEFMKEKRLVATEEREEASRARKANAQETQEYSLANLCKAYWKHLEVSGKVSAQDVRNALKLYVIKNNPDIAALKASNVTTDDVMTILRSIIEDGLTTTTNRVRSYLSAAYSFGIGSRLDPLAATRAGGFNLTSNPAKAVNPVSEFERAGERVLSEKELSSFLKRISKLDRPAAKSILLSLRMGGQRISQLLRATPKQYDEDHKVLTLYDPKGRRTQPRVHYLPVPNAADILLTEALLLQHPKRPGLFQGLTPDTCSKFVAEICSEMNCESFTWRDLRRTCETMLAAMHIPKDTRSQIQSHGLGGVQDKHYDKHDYLPVKRNTLDAWNRKLDELISGRIDTSNLISMAQKIR